MTCSPLAEYSFLDHSLLTEVYRNLLTESSNRAAHGFFLHNIYYFGLVYSNKLTFFFLPYSTCNSSLYSSMSSEHINLISAEIHISHKNIQLFHSAFFIHNRISSNPFFFSAIITFQSSNHHICHGIEITKVLCLTDISFSYMLFFAMNFSLHVLIRN